MELWIRSQDKMNLACVYSLYVIERDFAKNDSIWCEIYCNDEISLGLYLKERSLEVLDDIEDKLIHCVFAEKQNGLGEVLDFMPNSIYVYEMPKE